MRIIYDKWYDTTARKDQAQAHFAKMSSNFVKLGKAIDELEKHMSKWAADKHIKNRLKSDNVLKKEKAEAENYLKTAKSKYQNIKISKYQTIKDVADKVSRL